ncbi:hypothetical protein OF83DRAFT_1126129, partial [Amylostereum chailletii]
MSIPTTEQILHDRVNLVRLVRRLAKAVAQPDWNAHAVDPWIGCQSMLQKLKYARKLLRNVETYNEMGLSSESYKHHKEMRNTIDRLEYAVNLANDRVAPMPHRPPPVLPTVPLPPPSARGLEPPQAPASSVTPISDAPENGLLLGPAEETLSSPEDPSPARSSSTLLFPDASVHSTASTPPTPAATTNLSSTSAHLQNSAAVQEELTAQLAQMARQLKANASHFSESLAADKAAMTDTDEKIAANYEVMKRERVRLRDHRGKSMGTTCLTLTSVFVVAIAFCVMFFVIRL